jgi:N-acetylglucosaminyl-diphospho-decaprenol L-rhamnosyltransferase
VDAAVVIVNYRTPRLVEGCVASVEASRGDLAIETVIVDNASADGSAEHLRRALPSTQIIAMEQNRGFGAGVNAGFRATEADIVILLNPDTALRNDALVQLVRHLRDHPGTGVVAPLTEDPDGNIAPNGYKHFPGLWTVAIDLCVPLSYLLAWAPQLHPYVLSPHQLTTGRRPAWVSGAAMAIRRTAYEQAGGFDERIFLYFEEVEWQQRVAALDWDREVLPAARVTHLHGGGDAATGHSPYFLSGALVYLQLRGVPTWASRMLVAPSLAGSWLFLRVVSLLPAKHELARRRAHRYGALLREAVLGPTSPNGSAR